MNFSRILTYLFIASLIGSQVGAMDQAMLGGITINKLGDKVVIEHARNAFKELIKVGSSYPNAILFASGILAIGISNYRIFTIPSNLLWNKIKNIIPVKTSQVENHKKIH